MPAEGYTGATVYTPSLQDRLNAIGKRKPAKANTKPKCPPGLKPVLTYSEKCAKRARGVDMR